MIAGLALMEPRAAAEVAGAWFACPPAPLAGLWPQRVLRAVPGITVGMVRDILVEARVSRTVRLSKLTEEQALRLTRELHARVA